MVKVETAPVLKEKLATETSETVEKLVEVMGVNALNEAELMAKAEIISEYVKKTAETCKRAKIKRNDVREVLGRSIAIPGLLMFLVGAIWSIVNLVLIAVGAKLAPAGWIAGASLLVGGLVLSVAGAMIEIFSTCVCCGKRKALENMSLCSQCLQNDILAIIGQRKAPDYAVKAAKARLDNFIQPRMKTRMKNAFLKEVHELSSGMLLPATWDTKNHQIFELYDPRVMMPPEVEEKVERLKTTRIAPCIAEMKAFLKPQKDPIAVKVSLLGFSEWFKLAEWPQ